MERRSFAHCWVFLAFVSLLSGLTFWADFRWELDPLLQQWEGFFSPAEADTLIDAFSNREGTGATSVTFAHVLLIRSSF